MIYSFDTYVIDPFIPNLAYKFSSEKRVSVPSIKRSVFVEGNESLKSPPSTFIKYKHVTVRHNYNFIRKLKYRKTWQLKNNA